jgi:hypothetical protein
MASTFVSCDGKCLTHYLIPGKTDIGKLLALSPAQKGWLADEARKQFDKDPSTPFIIDDAAVLMSRHRGKDV